MPTSKGNLSWREWRRRRRKWRESLETGVVTPADQEAFDRLFALRREAVELPHADVAPFRALTVEEVRSRADEVLRRLDLEARRHGYAGTESGTEDDDWLKLAFLLELEDAETVAGLGAETAEEWARRMAVHAARRAREQDTPREPC